MGETDVSMPRERVTPEAEQGEIRYVLDLLSLVHTAVFQGRESSEEDRATVRGLQWLATEEGFRFPTNIREATEMMRAIAGHIEEQVKFLEMDMDIKGDNE